MNIDKCPRCGAKKVDSPECLQCGVIYAKAKPICAVNPGNEQPGTITNPVEIKELTLVQRDKRALRFLAAFLSVLFVIVVSVIAMSPQEKAPPAPTPQKVERILTPPPPAGISDSNRSLVIKNTVTAQRELESFLDELQAMRKTTRFHELGFSLNNKEASQWKFRVDAWRKRIESDKTVALEVRVASTSIIGLGMEWMLNKGNMNNLATWYAQEINTALMWKPE